jgi:hypothetical protein
MRPLYICSLRKKSNGDRRIQSSCCVFAVRQTHHAPKSKALLVDEDEEGF